MPYVFNPFSGSLDNAPSTFKGDSSYTTLQSASTNWDNAYSTVQSNSSTNWNYQGTDIKSLTGNWQDTYTIVQFNSANWNSTYSTLCSISGNLATYDYLHSEFLPLSGGTITGTLSVYGGFESGTGNTVLYAGNSSVGINTETPNEELTIVGDISATGIVYASGGNSDQWNSVYSTVQSNSSTNWNYTGTDLKNLSSNWESTYNTVSSISGSWLTSFYLSSNSITISALTVTSTISAKDQIYFENHKAIKTPTTDFAGVSAVTKIVAVSSIPVIQETGTLYVLI